MTCLADEIELIEAQRIGFEPPLRLMSGMRTTLR
jgi:hypothetical protein